MKAIKVAEGILLPQFPPDLSGYSLTTHTHSLSSLGAAASNHSHSGYASSSHSHSGYATQTWVTQNFAPKGSGGTTTDPTPPSTGGSNKISLPSGTIGTLSFTRVTSTTTNPVYVGKLYSYTVPSVVSSLRVSWTAVSGNITGSYYSNHDYETEQDFEDGRMVYLLLFSSNAAENTTNLNAYYGQATNQIVQLASFGINPGAYNNMSFAAGSWSFPTDKLAQYAGKNIYVGYGICAWNAIYGVNFQRNLTGSTSNPCQVTFTAS